MTADPPPPTGEPPPADAGDQPRYRLRLFVSGVTPRSTQAIANIKAIGDRYLHGRYDLEVIDAFEHPDLLRAQQVIVLPTLIRVLPLPVRRLVGDMSDHQRVLEGLELLPDKPDAATTQGSSP